MQEILEPITFAEKDSFIALKCAEMTAMANKQMLQEQKLQQISNQKLVQGQVTLLEDDLRSKKEEFENQKASWEAQMNAQIEEQQQAQKMLKKRADEAAEQAKTTEERLQSQQKGQQKDQALQRKTVECLERDLANAQASSQESIDYVGKMKQKLDEVTAERDNLREQLEQQRQQLTRELTERRNEEMGKLAREYEAKLEAKNELILAEMDRKANDEKEKQIRVDMLSSQ